MTIFSTVIRKYLLMKLHLLLERKETHQLRVGNKRYNGYPVTNLQSRIKQNAQQKSFRQKKKNGLR
jgi:hypothetical protein